MKIAIPVHTLYTTIRMCPSKQKRRHRIPFEIQLKRSKRKAKKMNPFDIIHFDIVIRVTKSSAHTTRKTNSPAPPPPKRKKKTKKQYAISAFLRNNNNNNPIIIIIKKQNTRQPLKGVTTATTARGKRRFFVSF